MQEEKILAIVAVMLGFLVTKVIYTIGYRSIQTAKLVHSYSKLYADVLEAFHDATIENNCCEEKSE